MASTDLRVPVAECRPDPRQPRVYFKKSALKSLALSIQEVGQRTPIEVRELPEGDTHRYEIIDGERRWRACQLGEIPTIRICIETAPIVHQEQHFLSVISNFHREGHTHIEISAALQYQVECAQGQKGIIRKLASNLGKSEPWVYQYLSLQNLVPELQVVMHPETPDKELLRFNEALVLASIPDAHQWYVYRAMVDLPVHKRLKYLRITATELTGKERKSGKPSDIKRHVVRFVARLQVDMDRVMDFKQADFQKAVADVPASDLRRFRDSIEAATSHLRLLMEATDRSLMIG